MKFEISIILLLTILVSCEKPAPVSQKETAPLNQPTLAAAQLAIAKSHIANDQPQQALPYLAAALENETSHEAQRLFENTLASTRFSVPVLQLTHPFAVTHIASSAENLYVALGGPYPTLIRWNLTDSPTVAAILFPTEAETISHLVLSSSAKHLLVQRDSTNLLCSAETLKPIAPVGTLPPGFDPTALQPFSENSLLVANPVLSPLQTITWHIRDTATGQPLRSATLPFYPKPTSAFFQDTTLIVFLEDRTKLAIPLLGEIEKTKTSPPPPTSPAPKAFTFSEETITLHHPLSPPLPLPPSLPLPLPTSLPLPHLTGFQLNPTTQSLEPTPTPNRLQTLSEIFPEIPPTLKIFNAQDPLETRLTAAFPEKFPALTIAARTHADIVRKSFASNNRSAILATISALPPSGLPTATALFLAHQSGDPELISAIIEKAENIPHALKTITAPGTGTPDLAALRATQDWLGYESPDFTSLFQNLRKKKHTTLSALTLSDSPSNEEIQTLFKKLLDPDTLRQLGPEAISNSATAAARSLSLSPDHAPSALQFTALAQRAGAHPAEILRIRATAFTSLADFASAHRSWLELITHQPEASHLPSDYSEAAYTAFENFDPRQAIEILETGIFRFPNDVTFAIRAGSIALLSNHPASAAKYLAHATTLGLPPDEIENTTALLAIAHSQLGDPETAQAYLEQLKAIDPSWADPAAIAKLPWPPPLIETLRALTSPQQEILPEPLPENDPTDTAPPSGEFPIPEPPLPSR